MSPRFPDFFLLPACSTLPITDAILDLGVQAFKHGDSLIQRENALHTFKVLFGVAFERWAHWVLCSSNLMLCCIPSACGLTQLMDFQSNG